MTPQTGRIAFFKGIYLYLIHGRRSLVDFILTGWFFPNSYQIGPRDEAPSRSLDTFFSLSSAADADFRGRIQFFTPHRVRKRKGALWMETTALKLHIKWIKTTLTSRRGCNWHFVRICKLVWIRSSQVTLFCLTDDPKSEHLQSSKHGNTCHIC